VGHPALDALGGHEVRLEVLDRRDEAGVRRRVHDAAAGEQPIEVRVRVTDPERNRDERLEYDDRDRVVPERCVLPVDPATQAGNPVHNDNRDQAERDHRMPVRRPRERLDDQRGDAGGQPEKPETEPIRRLSPTAWARADIGLLVIARSRPT
jgi:hypothetical protein